MDGQQFDRVTRALASGSSRRSVLKGLLGLGGALAAPAAGAAQGGPPKPPPGGPPDGVVPDSVCPPAQRCGSACCEGATPLCCGRPGVCQQCCGDEHCDDGNVCTDNTCSGGVCSFPFDCSNDPTSCCPECYACPPAGGDCVAESGTACGAEGSFQCSNGNCLCPGCVHAGICYPSGAAKPDDACSTCNGTVWGQAVCFTGTDICSTRANCYFNGECLPTGTAFPEGQRCGISSSVCEEVVCDGHGSCISRAANDGSSCGQGARTCLNGKCCACRDESGTCYADGDPNPDNLCEVCNAVSGWEPKPLVCASNNPCQTNHRCDPETGQCAFDPANEGSACSTGVFGQCQSSTGTCQSGQCVPDDSSSQNGDSCLFCNAHEQCGTCQCLDGACVAAAAPNSEGVPCGIDVDFCSDRVCQSGQCVAVPANEGVECGNQPLDTCRQAVCRNGTCINEYAGPNNAACTAGDLCLVGVCAPPGHCGGLQTKSCEVPTGCISATCNSATGACDVYTAPESGTRTCSTGLFPRPCCPNQVCARVSCNPFDLSQACFDPEDVPSC